MQRLIVAEFGESFEVPGQQRRAQRSRFICCSTIATVHHLANPWWNFD